MPTQFDPPSGTRDFLAAEWETREHAFERIRSVFARYGLSLIHISEPTRPY